jgi:GntR family transcriptional repressor for pyruvate dehydrogenase complex
MVGPIDQSRVDAGLFREIKAQKRKSGDAVRQILDGIKRGTLKPGQKLPSERELSAQMGISRNSLREALLALEVLGYTTSRVGDGTYLRTNLSEAANTADVLASMGHDRDLPDVWEARSEIEGVIVKMAVRSASDKSIERMADCFGAMRGALTARDAMQYIELDKKFHMAIARGADNDLLARIIQPLIEITNDYLFHGVEPEKLLGRFSVSIQEHKTILHAIQNRDQAAGVEAIAVHFRNVEKYFGKRLW